MANNRNPNYVSVRFWMFAMFMMAIPILGWLLILVWAFAGHNESRQNFFRAVIAWVLIFATISGAIIWFNLWPILEKQLQRWLQ